MARMSKMGFIIKIIDIAGEILWAFLIVAGIKLYAETGNNCYLFAGIMGFAGHPQLVRLIELLIKQNTGERAGGRET